MKLQQNGFKLWYYFHITWNRLNCFVNFAVSYRSACNLNIYVPTKFTEYVPCLINIKGQRILVKNCIKHRPNNLRSQESKGDYIISTSVHYYGWFFFIQSLHHCAYLILFYNVTLGNDYLCLCKYHILTVKPSIFSALKYISDQAMLFSPHLYSAD